MIGHPGKKLLFMGQEFGQLREWSEKRELDWFLLSEERHRQLQNYVRQLLKLYQDYKSLYELDSQPEGFEWINGGDNFRSIFSFVRHSSTKRKNLLFIINFTPVDRPDYRVGVPKKKTYKRVLTTEAPEFGGEGITSPGICEAVKQECDGRPYSFAYPLKGYGAAVFEF